MEFLLESIQKFLESWIISRHTERSGCMRFRKRLQMHIIPILLFAVLFVTATVVYTTNYSVRTLQEDIMKYRLDVVLQYTSSEYETLSRVNLQKSKHYVEESKDRIFEFIKETELPGGFFIIANSNDDVVFHSKDKVVGITRRNESVFI